LKTTSLLVLATAIFGLTAIEAQAKVNYTSISGESYCCDNVGPSGHAAQGCVKNAGGAQCAAIKFSGKGVFDVDVKGRNSAARRAVIGKPAPAQ
jgi:hypothetical protein